MLVCFLSSTPILPLPCQCSRTAGALAASWVGGSLEVSSGLGNIWLLFLFLKSSIVCQLFQFCSQPGSFVSLCSCSSSPCSFCSLGPGCIFPCIAFLKALPSEPYLSQASLSCVLSALRSAIHMLGSLPLVPLPPWTLPTLSCKQSVCCPRAKRTSYLHAFSQHSIKPFLIQ